MSKFKRVMVFNPGEVLKTTKDELTDWTFISESHSNPTTGKRYINVRCKCGKEKVVCVNNVRSGTSSSCGLSPCRGKEREKDHEVGYKAILYVYKKHAKDRGFTFNLDYDYFKELTKGNCHYCGIEPIQVYQLKNPKTGKIRSGIPVKYNGIDRIDSSKGYFNDNVVTCCKICNRAKSNSPLDEFKEWIKRIYMKTIKTDLDGPSN
jgi:hypothetical protein